MIFSINFFNRVFGLILLIALFTGSTDRAVALLATDRLLAPIAERAGSVQPSAEITVINPQGESVRRSTGVYRSVFNNIESSPLPDPLVANTIAVSWAIKNIAEGNARYRFEIEKDGSAQPPVSTGSEPRLVWIPEEAGSYRVRVHLSDDSDLQLTSPWSEALRVVPALSVGVPEVDPAAPQMAQSRAIHWKVNASGGDGELSYVYEVNKSDRLVARVGTGRQPSWDWYPDSPGTYRVRAAVTDTQGNSSISDWSAPYQIKDQLSVVLQGVPTETLATAYSSGIPLVSRVEGGVGELSYLLLIEKDGLMLGSVSLEKLDGFRWIPEIPGSYRLGILVTDAANNQAVSPWTDSFTVSPALHSFIEKQQVLESGQVVWTASAAGGSGSYKYEFFQRHEEGEAELVSGNTHSTLRWKPSELGDYQMMVVVTDAAGNRAESSWSDPYQIAPSLKVEPPQIDFEGSQLELSRTVTWSVASSGGFGKKNYRFVLQRNEEEPQVLQAGDLSELDWSPVAAGTYKIKVIVEDSLGHRLESPWSAPVNVVTNRVYAIPASPQKALAGPVKWSFDYLGVKEGVDFTFTLVKNGLDLLEYESGEPQWLWLPKNSGKYRVRAAVKNSNGQTIASDLSDEYVITPAIDRDALVAVLPTENLSGVKAPLKYIRDTFSNSLAANGMKLLEEATLQGFLRKNRVRYTGGVTSKTGESLKEEVGNDAVFILSVETYQDADPPKISLIARLVLCDKQPKIAWMDSVGLSGSEAPGLLELGLIMDDTQLINKAVDSLIGSFINYLDSETEPARMIAVTESGEKAAGKFKHDSRYLPTSSYRSPNLDFSQIRSVAVLPFTNRFAQKNSGRVVPLYLIKHLLNYEGFNVIEPGLVRETLLKYRVVMEGGPSLSVSDIVTSESVLGADLMIAGNVFDYQGLRGEPKVHFSVQTVDAKSREVVWWSSSYASGNEGVVFFDLGRIYTAHGLTERLARSLVSLLVNEHQ